MMHLITPLSSSPTSPTPASSPNQDGQSNGSSPRQSPLCWAAQAERDLAQAKEELCRMQERHTTEIESVKRGVERAILGARREERRLLERVEQDHRDTQQRLEQIQKENMAAARVGQTLLDQKLCKLAQLQQQIREISRSDLNENGSKNLLLKEVAEFLQPWEIAISLKKVNYKPSSQPNAVTFGDMHVQDQNLCLNVGGCGPHGKPCALHSKKMECEINHQSFRKEERSQGQGRSSPTGKAVTMSSLSNRIEREAAEEQKLSTAKICHWLPKCEQSDWESFQDELESSSIQQYKEDMYLAVPSVLKNMDSKSKGELYKMKMYGNQFSPRNWKKKLSVASSRMSSPSPERRPDSAKISHFLRHNTQDGDRLKVSPQPNKRLLRYGNSALTSPSMTPRHSLVSQSCLDLTSKGRPLSCLSQSSDEHSLGTLGDSGRALSPTDSLDSSYTFIVSPSHDYSLNRASLNHSFRLSKSAVDLTHESRPLINSGTNKQELCRVRNGNFSSLPRTPSETPCLSRSFRVHDRGQTFSYPTNICHDNLQQKKATVSGIKQPFVARSLSMSEIDGSSQELNRSRGEREELVLQELDEEIDPSHIVFNPRDVHLIGQFGKQGSGRADLTLPSGIHATPQGQLFIVDCGNARVQVTDPHGNVLQQVASPNADCSTRRCRNYFDIAVNAKGLIALSCAAERALLVFNRHGRLLQTFGGSGFGSTKDELEAPRGVTVTRLDEFLVADIRKGTLIALKLEPKTGSRLERTVVTGFHRPYLVAACLSSGMVAVSERGNETGRLPCIKVLEPGWNTVRVLGVCAGMGPVLTSPWGICVDTDGNVLVADWGEQHRIIVYPAQGVGWPIISQGLSSPRGLTLLPEGQLAVSDSMHHCIKMYQYKADHSV
uniref:E3 ubiquitin-protein ligase TRIM32 n=1 Tax=Nothobranchius furzeri TaxID=105023 RepID=A0A8C6LLV2_NOTFU